jgi:hypothetical protein
LHEPPLKWNVHDNFFVFQEACKNEFDERVHLILMSEEECTHRTFFIPVLVSTPDGDETQN